MTHVHLIGIGGTGISSIARVLLEKGYEVSGSDRILSSLAVDLRTAGVTVFEGHAAENITGADIVVRSSAIPDSNIEVQAALAKGIPVLKRSDFLDSLLNQYKSIAIAGSHGKTTTSAMMAWTLKSLEQDPSYILGGVSKNLKNNAHAGSSELFVIEADEYDRMFLGLTPDVILLTNIGYDHPDCFPTIQDYEGAFHQFVNCLKPGGLVVANADDAARLQLFKSIQAENVALNYGFNSSAMYRAVNLKVNQLGGFTFDITYNGNLTATVNLSVPGEHNVLNALGVFATLTHMGYDPAEIAAALELFEGTGRRFEVVGEVNGITVIDDYAHHPAKIQATLAAARNRYPSRRIVAVWQPHTYSRTKALETEFVASFHNADLIIVSEIYASREKLESYSSRQVADAITYTETHFIPTLPEINRFLVRELHRNDVLIVLSAGDANQVCTDVLTALSERND